MFPGVGGMMNDFLVVGYQLSVLARPQECKAVFEEQ